MLACCKFVSKAYQSEVHLPVLWNNGLKQMWPC